MIVTKSWLNEWVDISDKSVDEICVTLNQIGLEVDSAKSYRVPDNIIVGFVLECEKHPDAEKLNVCKVDVGTGVRQIVCGASNVREGIFVAVAMIGATMPNGMEIKPVKLRGVESDGMICSASELELPSIGDGIMILDDSIGELKAGNSLQGYEVLNDDVIEIELTANRGDCLSHQGVARDLAAAYERTLKKQELLDSDYRRQGTGRVLHLTHQNDIKADVIYKSFEYSNFDLPLKVRYRLILIDEACEDHLDATLRYTTISTGVVLRSYQHSHFRKESDIAEIKLSEDSNGITIIEGNDLASQIGIRQNDDSKVTQSAVKVIIEGSYIDPELISKQVFEQALETDELYYRTSRGSEPDIKLGINMCADILMGHCDVTIIPGTFEYFSPYQEKTLNLDVCSINSQIGDEIEKAKIVKVLTGLGFGIVKSHEDNIVVNPPRFRHDITSEQDVVEEIVRIVGIDNINSKPLSFVEANTYNNAYNTHKRKRDLRIKATMLGFFETQTYLFGDKSVYEAMGFETTVEALALTNPIVETMDVLRPSIVPALVKAASENKKLGQKRIALFEYGTVFDKERVESVSMTFLHSGPTESEGLNNNGQPKIIDFATFVQKVADVVGDFTLEAIETTVSNLEHPYQLGVMLKDGSVIGKIYKLHPKVANEYDLEDTFVAEVDATALVVTRPQAKAYSKYQAVHRDISIVVPNTYTYSTLKTIVDELNITELQAYNLVDTYSDESLGENESITLRFTLQSLEKTLKDKEINAIMNSIISGFETSGYMLR